AATAPTTVNAASGNQSPALVTVMSVSIQKASARKTNTSQIVIQFSGALNPATAVPLSVYRLATLVSGKKPSSKPIALPHANYNAQGQTVALTTRKPLKLTRKTQLQLTILAKSVLDTLSRSLDGDHDGQPGGDYTAKLTKAGPVAIKAVGHAGP